ncbi:MAG: BACON domain-containing protein [Prevotellaceae bacterium]|jgi:O-acetylhomoserine/O-acetylserine sulfhydrylase-like pyridoxal-dependent enzyme|nr:BACON domain-containing protein [Prevotellaceae bacterium]
MKRILLISCVFCLIQSCSDDEKAALDLNVTPSVLEFDNTESTKKIYITSNTQWASSCEQEWCSVSVIQKSGNDTVDVQVLENSGDERIAYISFGNPEKTIIKTVKVVQKAKDENFGLVNSTAYFLRPSRVTSCFLRPR